MGKNTESLLILFLSPGTASATLSDLIPGGYGSQPPIATAVVDLFQNQFGSVCVSKNGSTALLLLLGLVPVVVALRVLKRRKARRTGHTYVRFFGQSSWDTRSRVSGPPIECRRKLGIETHEHAAISKTISACLAKRLTRQFASRSRSS